MPKSGPSKIKRTQSSGQFVSRPSQAEELARLKGYVTYLKKHPDEARKLTVSAGIYTKSGKLTKAFGG